ncbi:copper chaperone PCu(A)C [Flocculibacter collagenilyticus]|uniref:copper chaperone PCu(A)C n=1 Tax=Flocculibacter collagenilyticus TaxID=2744479 RepID=UPI0018F716E2|nr:copper chaperone PCu(A)C [Flocculibacter collagenilyticus]
MALINFPTCNAKTKKAIVTSAALFIMTFTQALVSFQVSAHAQHHDNQQATLSKAPSIIATKLRMNAMPPSAPVTAAYLTLNNQHHKEAELTHVTSKVSDNIEIHQHLHENGVMKMRKMDKLSIAANSVVQFQPGGLHLMVFNPKSLKVDDNFTMTLHFSDGHTQVVEGKVVSLLEQNKASHDMHRHH